MNSRLARCVGAMIMAVVMAIFMMEPAWSQEQEVYLSPIEMVESKDTIDYITQVDMERKTATNLRDALKGVAGVFQTTSAGRNEGTISIRGSSRFQVGMFIDDIPIATAYRNEWDYNNTLVYDLESIEVSKGYSSPLLIANNGLSGTINLRTAKPAKELEFTAKYMNFFDRYFDDQGRFFAASVGTKQKWFYLKATVMQSQQDFFTLPSSFTSSLYEDGKRRENSDYKNKGLNLIAGFTPTEKVDIMFGFVRQSMEKGQPPDAAQTYTNPPYPTAYPFARFWRWPEYETTRYYVNANVGLTEKANLKGVVYYDGHKDTTYDYTNASFEVRRPGGQTYDQYTSGGQLTFDYTFNAANKIAASAGYRRLSHKSTREETASGVGVFVPNEHMTEDYWDFGAEYTFKPIKHLTLVFGGNYTYLNPKTTERFVGGAWQPYYVAGQVDADDLFNYQVGAFYDLTKDHEIFLTFAKKARFATMRERYIRTSGGAPANPDLNPEKAFHYEAGYRGRIGNWLKINSSIYYSDVSDLIFQDRDASGNTYFRNIDEADFYGFELGGEALVNKYLSAGLTFNYLKWNNDTRHQTNINLTQLPKFSGTVYAVISPLEGLSIIPQVNMSSNFYMSSNPNDAYSKASDFATADLKVVYDFKEHLTFEIGARNIFDKEYAYGAYHPEPGRNFFVGITGRY